MELTTGDTIRRQVTGLFPLIARQNNSLRTRLNTFRGGETDDEGDSSEEDSEDEASITTRQSELCDILSSFQDSMLPDQFQQKYADGVPATLSMQSCLVENDLQASLYRLAMRDSHVYRSLQRLVPGNTRAIRYYKKQEARAVRALQLLDEYAQRGSLNPRDSIPQCARMLRAIVHEVYEDLQARRDRGSITQRAAEQSAACLVRTVEEVVGRRRRDFFDQYEDLPQGMPWRNHSIFAYLISDPPHERRMEGWLRDLFVIERLPRTQWVQLYDRLDAIAQEIRETVSSNEPAAAEYADRIGRLLLDYNQTIDDPSSSSTQQRMPRP